MSERALLDTLIKNVEALAIVRAECCGYYVRFMRGATKQDPLGEYGGEILFAGSLAECSGWVHDVFSKRAQHGA